MKKTKIWIILIAGLLNNTAVIKAQIEPEMKIDSSHVTNDSLRFKYRINLSMVYNKGRLNQIRIPLQGYNFIGNDKHSVELFYQYTYQKLNGFEMQNDLLTRAVYSFKYKNRIHPLAGYIYETSKLYQLKSRYSPAVGMGIHLLEKNENNMVLRVIASYDQTEFYNISGYETLRANVILSGRQQLVKN